MPNWCSNGLIVEGVDVSAEAGWEFREFTVRADVESGLLGKFVSCPSVLLTAGDAAPWEGNSGGCVDLVADVVREAELIAMCGYGSWYSWCVGEWGAKWDVDVEAFDSFEGCTRIMFSSAWAPPVPWVFAVSRLFPLLRFTLGWAESGVGFWGFVQVEGGVVVDYGEWDEGLFVDDVSEEEWETSDVFDLLKPEVRVHLDRFGLHTGG